MVDSITWRTTDITRWGSGLGSPLSGTQVDINFWVLLTRLIAVEDHAAVAAVGIENFYINPSNSAEFFVVLTDSTQLGPYILPQTAWVFTNPPSGTWVALSAYGVNDIFTYGRTLYAVLIAHTSAATFDPNATDGSTHPLYQILFTVSIDEAVQDISASTWTPGFADLDSYTRFTGTGASQTITVPTNGAVAFSVGAVIEVRNASATSVVIVSPSGGVTVNAAFGRTLTSLGQGATFALKKVATNEWDALGDFALL